MKKAILLFLMVSCWVFANAQQKTISGTISDESGSPLPGVNVVLKGTTVGTITDLDGNYSLEVPSDETILVISYLGYLSEEIQVGGQTTIDLKLTPSLEALEEVVVIGYGSVKKKDLTGSVASVEGGDIEKRSTTQLSQALQGAMPGVTVTRNNSAPGATGTVRIRGITTMSNNDPLVIVDGVPGYSLNDVNTSDIENITVLKDAAAASIYGSQAAAGVILITTKRAKEGKAKLNYSYEFGLQTPTEMPDYVGVKRYVEMLNELQWNDANNAAGAEFSEYSQEVAENYLELSRQDPNKYPNTDWTSLLMKDYSTRQKHSVGFSIGADKIKSYGSVNYETGDALYDYRKYERYTVRLNNSVKLNKFISTDVDLAYKRSNDDKPHYSPMGGMRVTPPDRAALWSDGRVAKGRDGNNPYAAHHFGGFKDEVFNTFNAKFGVYIKPVEGLKISAIFAPKVGFTYKKHFKKAATFTDTSDVAGLNPQAIAGYEFTELTEERNENYSSTTQALVNYKKTLLGSHNLDFMVGYEYRYRTKEDVKAQRKRYEINTFPYLNLGPEDNQTNGSGANHLKRESVFGRIMYNYRSRYYIQGNLRYDASSRFRKENRWGAFPSFSAGWVVSEEAFMPETSVLSFLKLRASYGVLGNERISGDDWFPYLAQISFNNTLFYGSDGIESRLTAAQTRWAIESLTWETTATINFGIDVNFLDNRLRFNGDYYEKTTKDMLLTAEMPDHAGYDDAQRNAGEMSSKGWEFVVSWKDRIGELGYSASFHMSDNKTEMLDMGGKREEKDGKITEEGSQYKEWFGYVSNGLWQSEEEIKAAEDQGYTLYKTPKPGDVRYMDISGPDGVPDSVINEFDKAYMGGSFPRYSFGSTIKLDYKGIDFAMVFQGVGKVNKKLTAYMVKPLNNRFSTPPAEIDGKYWSMYNSEEQNLAAEYPRISETSGSRNYVISDYWMFNGGYFRLKSVTLGYTLPKTLTSRIGINSVRVYTTALDVFSIDNYIKGWDPEVTQDSHPITRTFLFGAQLNF